MEGETSNPSNILRTILTGSVTTQQWESYKQMRNERGDLICSDDDESENDNSDNDAADTSQRIEESNTLSVPNEWDCDVTFKYLDGQLSFYELAKIMEKNDKSDNDTEEGDNYRPEVVFEKEFLESQYKGKKSRKSSPTKERAVRSRAVRLPRDLVGLMGEANVCFARGDHEDALKMCMEVIRLVPTAAEPFQSLGMFYEEMGDEQKAFQIFLIAAYLCPSDGEGWIKVAEMANELEHHKEAITCYSKAIKIFPDNIKLHFQRCQLYEKIGDMKRAIDGYDNLIRALQPNDGDLALRLAKDIVKIHYNNGSISTGIEVMEAILSKYHSFVTSEEVNVYLELLIADKQYLKSLSTFQKFCGVKFLLGDHECEELNEENVSNGSLRVHLMYLELPIDLRAKLIVSLINLRCLLSIDELLDAVLIESPEEIGDLYLDVVDALMHMQLYANTNPLLFKLLNTEKYNIADVWLRYAKCLEKCGNIESSIIAYSTVVRLSPNQFQARLTLSNLLLNVGKEKEALEASSHCESDGEVDIELLFMRCKLLYSNKLWSEFASAARLLLQSEMMYLKHNRELSVMVSSSSYRTRIDSLKDVHRELGVSFEMTRPKFIGKALKREELLEIFIKLCHTLTYKLHDHNELIRVAFSSFTSYLFADIEETIDFYALMCCYISNNHQHTYPLIKALISRNLYNNHVWNLFCAVMMRFYQDLRHNRFCIRLFIKNPDHLALAYFNGHNALMSGSYKHALAEYVCIFKQNPKDHFAAFCVALSYVHLACQKYTSNRHSIVVQLCAFLDIYLELRGECHESFYNVGRAFHQLGLFNNAVHFYKKALQCTNSIQNDHENVYDLRRETVYNLVLIYRKTGANHLALQYLKKHFVV